MPKTANIYSCELCNFTCSKESNWKIHISTNKHNKRTNTNAALKKMRQNTYVIVVKNTNTHRRYGITK
jgi:hypothetical protein